MGTITRTESFDLAYRFVTETNLNVFLTGKAGTGKTTFLKYLRENSVKEMVVAAPTGVAAINAGGVTLHSLFHLPFSPFIPVRNAGESLTANSPLIAQVRYNKDKLNIFRNLELLVIDEVSMVASHTVDAIDTILRVIRRRRDLPFGGVQVLFIGDLYQLPPVVRNQEWEMLRSYYPSIFFFDSIVLREHIPVMVELKEIFRQQDTSFIDILNEIRNNQLTPHNFSLLNSRLKTGFIPADEEGFITLTTHNNQSDTINKSKLEKLKGKSKSFTAETEGDFPENMYPVDKVLELKVGAQVMFLKNDNEFKQYFNGKIGVVTSLEDDCIYVKCKGEKNIIEVGIYEWENVNYKLNPDTREITEEKLGSFFQYPLRLAWAITIHKSQGLTFDKLIIDAENAFANGQVYVALSRCTSLEGLVLTSPVNKKFLGAHFNLVEWQQKNQDEANLFAKFQNSRRRFILQEMKSVFTWTEWYFNIKELGEVLNEFRNDLLPACFEWHIQLNEKHKVLHDVTIKFRTRIDELSAASSDPETNELLQNRLKDASGYFFKGIIEWMEIFKNHPLTTDTRKVSKKLDAAMEDTNFAAQEILHKVEFCKTGFNLNGFLEKGKKKNLVVNPVSSVYAAKQEKIVAPKEIEHKELYDRIASYRREIAGDTNLPLYTIFSNNTILNVCETLPGNEKALMKVKGFGKATVSKYGEELLQIISDYCQENNLKPESNVKDEPPKIAKTPTLDETLRLIKEGKSIAETAKERNFAESTIEGHIAKAIKLGEIDIKSVMPMEEVYDIASKFPNQGETISLSSIKSELPSSVSYGKLQMVLAWKQWEKSTMISD